MPLLLRRRIAGLLLPPAALRDAASVTASEGVGWAADLASLGPGDPERMQHPPAPAAARARMLLRLQAMLLLVVKGVQVPTKTPNSAFARATAPLGVI